jgi:hypothetical protein
MPQVSRPIQIALIAAVAFLAAWFTMLRPRGDEPAPAPAASAAHAPATAGSGGAAPTGSAPATAPAPDQARPAASPKPSSPGATKRRTASGAPAARVRRALNGGKVVVLLFWNGRSPDDAAAREAVLGADRHGGRVVTVVAPLSQASRYASVTQGARIAQSPTILVVNPARRARLIVGFTDTAEVDQVVSDALGAKR